MRTVKAFGVITGTGKDDHYMMVLTVRRSADAAKNAYLALHVGARWEDMEKETMARIVPVTITYRATRFRARKSK